MANPMYRQIAEDLRAQIESGELRPGQQLRTEIELRDRYGASRNTVRDAIKWLTTLGLVETRPGQGTFVVEARDPFVTTLTGDAATGVGGDEGAIYRSEVSARNRKPDTSPVQVEIQRAAGEVAFRLRIPEGTEVISRHERRFIDGIPWSMQTSFYPMSFADRGAQKLRSAGNIDEGTVEYLAKTLGLKQVGYQDWITSRTPNATEADFFQGLAGRPGRHVRGIQDRLRRERHTDAAVDHRIPGRPQPVHRERRRGSGGPPPGHDSGIAAKRGSRSPLAIHQN